MHLAPQILSVRYLAPLTLSSTLGYSISSGIYCNLKFIKRWNTPLSLSFILCQFRLFSMINYCFWKQHNLKKFEKIISNNFKFTVVLFINLVFFGSLCSFTDWISRTMCSPNVPTSSERASSTDSSASCKPCSSQGSPLRYCITCRSLWRPAAAVQRPDSVTARTSNWTGSVTSWTALSCTLW